MKLPRTLAPAINQVASKALGKEWSLYASLIEHWREIVGEDYAKTTTPVKIIFLRGKKQDEKWASSNRGGGSLTIRLPQGLAMEFNFHAEQIKSRINGFFGYTAIDRIILEPYYDERKIVEKDEIVFSHDQETALAKDTSIIENNELREALEQLGKSVMTKG